MNADTGRGDRGGPRGDDTGRGDRGGPRGDDTGRWHSRGYLPHFDGGERPQIVTFRLADSFPRHLLDAWADELALLPEREAATESHGRIEAYIDRGAGAAWLRDRASPAPCKTACDTSTASATASTPGSSCPTTCTPS